MAGHVFALAVARSGELWTAHELRYTMPDVENLTDMTVIGRGAALSVDVSVHSKFPRLGLQCEPRMCEKAKVRACVDCTTHTRSW